MIRLERVSSRGVDTAHFGIDPISSKYRASIADTDIKTIHLNDQQQLKVLSKRTLLAEKPRS